MPEGFEEFEKQVADGTYTGVAEDDKPEEEVDPDTEEEEVDPDTEDESDDAEEEEVDPDTEDEPDEDEPEEEEKPKRKRKPTAAERINALTKARHEAEAKADKARQDAQEAQDRLAELEKAEKAAAAPEPDPNDPKYRYGVVDEAYLNDRAQYEADRRFATLQKEQAEKDATSQQEKVQAHYRERVDIIIADGIEKYNDFEETYNKLADGDVPLTAEFGQLMLDSNHGADIAHVLVNDPAEAARISALSPMAQAVQFGKMEARFSTSAKSDGDPKEKVRTTKAPTPPKRRTRGKGGKSGNVAGSTDFTAFEAKYGNS